MAMTLEHLTYDLNLTRQQLDSVRQELSLLRTRSLMQPQYYPASMRTRLAEQETHLLKRERNILRQISELEAAQ